MTRSTDVVLVYPQRAPQRGRHWIMPSLGLMYLSASLRRATLTKVLAMVSSIPTTRRSATPPCHCPR